MVSIGKSTAFVNLRHMGSPGTRVPGVPKTPQGRVINIDERIQQRRRTEKDTSFTNVRRPNRIHHYRRIKQTRRIAVSSLERAPSDSAVSTCNFPQQSTDESPPLPFRGPYQDPDVNSPHSPVVAEHFKCSILHVATVFRRKLGTRNSARVPCRKRTHAINFVPVPPDS